MFSAPTFHVEGFHDCVHRDISLHLLLARGLLLRFGQNMSRRYRPLLNRGKPFFGQSQSLFIRNISGDSQYRIVRCIVAIIKRFYLIEGSPFDMGYVTTYYRPAIWVTKISHFAYQSRNIAIRLIQCPLFEFLNDNCFLYVEATLRKVQSQHAVRFQPKGGLYILPRDYGIVICNIITRPCVVLASCLLQFGIEIRHMK